MIAIDATRCLRLRPHFLNKRLKILKTQYCCALATIPTPSEEAQQLVDTLDRLLLRRSVQLLNEPQPVMSPDERRRFAVAVEVAALRRAGFPVPTHVSEKMIRGLAVCPEKTQAARKNMLQLFRRREVEMEEKVEKKLIVWTNRAQNVIRRMRDESPSSDVTRGFYDEKGYFLLGPFPSIRRRFVPPQEALLHNANALHGWSFGQPFVIDLGLPYSLEGREATSVISQMQEIYALNRSLWDPFKLVLSNYDPNNSVMKSLVESCSTFLLDVNESCFTATFPRERLVYLSPDAPDVLTGYRHDDVFVLGALVDLRRPGRYTLERAKSLGVRAARLDLDSYLELTRQKPPYMAYSDVFACVLDARDTNGNWFYAFRNFISGRKRILKWREELEASAPASRDLDADYKEKFFENNRALLKSRFAVGARRRTNHCGGEEETESVKENLNVGLRERNVERDDERREGVVVRQ